MPQEKTSKQSHSSIEKRLIAMEKRIVRMDRQLKTQQYVQWAKMALIVILVVWGGLAIAPFAKETYENYKKVSEQLSTINTKIDGVGDSFNSVTDPIKGLFGN